MLNHRVIATNRRAQRGIVLLLSIIVLVAMSLAAMGLMRSVLNSNRVAANLAFQQSATQSASVGIETAIAWLEQKSRQTDGANPPQPLNLLFNRITASASEPYHYLARREDPAPGQSWEAFWTVLTAAGNQINTLPEDSAGNTVAFVIHRLCDGLGAPTSNCETPTSGLTAGQGQSKTSGMPLKLPDQTYYRITVRVQGPRNAVSFVQALVSM
jgi:type IV pilus assembly protein PilX